MPITLFDEDYDTVFRQIPVQEQPPVKPNLKLRSVSGVYAKYAMSDIFEFNNRSKHKEDVTTPTTGIPESVSSASASISEANFDELSKLITLDIQSSILDGLDQYEAPNIEAIEKLLKSDLLETVKYDSFEYENERQHLRAYKNAINEAGLVKVRYKKSPSNLVGYMPRIA